MVTLSWYRKKKNRTKWIRPAGSSYGFGDLCAKMAAVRKVKVYVVLATFAFSAAMLLGSTVEPPGGECEAHFIQDLFTCFTNQSVPFNTFLWVAGNKMDGIPPANETQFKDHMCRAEDQVVHCVLGSLHALVDEPFCQNADGMEQLLTGQLRTIFEEYDFYCANECRQTLEDDMRKCYDDHGLSPKLFMPESGDGAILGDSSSSVETFCSKRESVVACLKEKIDACPEAPYVLKRLGLDINTFSTGLKLLCREQDVYLSSLECFQKQTRAVEKCQEDNRLSLMRLLARTKAESVSEESFFREFCLDRVQYVRCDLASWATKEHESCDSPALALKRDLHCSQIPAPCSKALAGPIQKVCTYDWATAELTSVSSGSQAGSSGGTSGYRAPMTWQGLFLSVVVSWSLSLVSAVSTT